MSRDAAEERGAAALLVLAMCGVLMSVAAALGVVNGLVVAHRRAQAAADLAALAGAGAVARGGKACHAAAEMARANSAELRECALRDSTVTVRVAVEGPHWLGQRADLEARARAGP